MIVLLKMQIIGNIFSKTHLEAIRDASFPICGVKSGQGHRAMERGDSIFWWGTEEWGIFEILGMRAPLPSVGSPD